MRSPGAPLPRPTPTPEGGGGRNKARLPRLVPGAAEPERGRGAPGRGRPGRGRREAAGLPLPSTARSLRLVPTAAARIPAPGVLRDQSSPCLSASPAPRGQGKFGSSGSPRGSGRSPFPPPTPRAPRKPRGSALRLGTGWKGKAGGPRLRLIPSPRLPSPQPAAVGRRGPWAEPWRSARGASGGG